MAASMNNAEKEGRWPEQLRVTQVSLIPKEGACHEGKLRPIGILPYFYRVWMAVRGRDAQPWCRVLYGSRHKSATELVWTRNVAEDLVRAKGWFMLTAFLACSKCYERIRHDEAQKAALGSGCPPEIVNLALNMYGGRRHIQVHGSLSQGFYPTSGLVAGCARARDILQSVLRPLLLSLIHI